jgi:hypothetical protein
MSAPLCGASAAPAASLMKVDGARCAAPNHNGSVNGVLTAYGAAHSSSLPANYDVAVNAVAMLVKIVLTDLPARPTAPMAMSAMSATSNAYSSRS